MSFFIPDKFPTAGRERANGLCEYCLFHEEHAYFKYELEETLIKPLTPIGEVTVKILDINNVDRILERQVLIAAGRYPHPAVLEKIGG